MSELSVGRSMERKEESEAEPRNLLFKPNCEIPGSFESEKEMGDLVVEAKQAKEKDEPLIIEEKQESEFDPKAIDAAVRQKIKTIIDGPLVDRFFSEINPDDLDQVQKILSKSATMGSPNSRLMANIIKGQLNEKGQLAQAEERMDKAMLQERIKVLNRELMQIIESEINRDDLFGTNSNDIQVIGPRDEQLYLYRVGLVADRHISDVISYLIKKEKSNIKKEAAEEETEAEPEEAAVELKEEVEGPQPWLDQEREKASQELLATLANVEKEGGQEAIQDWFASEFNQLLEKYGGTPLEKEYLEGLFYVPVKSESASEIAGQDIIRPVFMFEEEFQFKKFYQKLSGQEKVATMGFYSTPDKFSPESILSKTGLLIENGSKEIMDHEIRHSIDPFSSREGADQIISEAFAYYQDVIENNQDWDSYHRLLSHQEYFSSKIHKAVAGEKGNFDFLVSSLVNSVRRISQREGHLETQRILAQCKTMQDLLAQVNQ